MYLRTQGSLKCIFIYLFLIILKRWWVLPVTAFSYLEKALEIESDYIHFSSETEDEYFKVLNRISQLRTWAYPCIEVQAISHGSWRLCSYRILPALVANTWPWCCADMGWSVRLQYYSQRLSFCTNCLPATPQRRIWVSRAWYLFIVLVKWMITDNELIGTVLYLFIGLSNVFTRQQYPVFSDFDIMWSPAELIIFLELLRINE